MSVIGIRRISHLNDVCDRGFNYLVGKLYDQSTIQKTLKHLNSESFKKLADGLAKTFAAYGLFKGNIIDIDGHFIPYWGSAEVGKGKNSTMNRVQKGVEIYCSNCQETQNVIAFIVKEGNTRLKTVLPSMIKDVREILGKIDILVVFDREGYSGALFEKLDKELHVRFLTMAKNYKTIIKRMRSIPLSKFVFLNEEWDVAEKFAHIPKFTGMIRMIVIRNRKTRERRAYLTIDKNIPKEIVSLIYDGRWGQENVFKVFKNGLFIDVLPGIKIKDGKISIVERAFFTTTIKIFTFNLVSMFKEKLDKNQQEYTLTTLQRVFFNRPAKITLKDDMIEISLEHFESQDVIKGYVEWINQNQFRIPWIENRILRVYLQNRLTDKVYI